MQQMEVKPPAAAAFAPVSIVSACSMPGSRKCTWMSMKPGATTSPVASYTSALPKPRLATSAAMRPFSRAKAAVASKADAGSITRPFLIRSLFTDDPFEHRHAHGDAVFDLVENHRPLRVGDLGGQLAAPIDGTWVHDDYIRLGQFDVLEAQTEKLEVLARGERRFVLPLELY